VNQIGYAVLPLACSAPTNFVGRGQSASRVLLLEPSQQSVLPRFTGSRRGYRQIVLFFFGQAPNPSRPFLPIRASVQRRRNGCSNFDEVFVPSKKLDQRMEGSLLAELFMLRAKEPSEIKAGVASRQVRAQRQKRA
jgi:hypothetical protein